MSKSAYCTLSAALLLFQDALHLEEYNPQDTPPRIEARQNDLRIRYTDQG